VTVFSIFVPPDAVNALRFYISATDFLAEMRRLPDALRIGPFERHPCRGNSMQQRQVFFFGTCLLLAGYAATAGMAAGLQQQGTRK
jgi:hypothetical protein